MSRRALVPFPDLADAAPDGLPVDVWDGEGPLPDTAGEVTFWVPPYLGTSEALEAGLPRMPQLEVLQSLSAGVDSLVGSLPDGVTLCNAKGVHDASTAELAVTLALAAQRGVPEFVRAQDEGRWVPERYRSLTDATVLVVGYGSIGQAIEARLQPFEVDVLRVARRARDGVSSMDELPELLPRADVVVLVVPMTEQTRGLVDAAFLRLMKDDALLVNVARGPVVDTGALLAELRSGRLRAALDVTDPEPLPADSPLWRAPGVLVSPHVGGNTTAFLPRARRLVVDQLRRYAAGEQLANVISGEY